MSFFNSFVDRAMNRLVAKAIDQLDVKNEYKDLGLKGKLLSYVEKQPVIAALLESSLGTNRVKLYEAVTENADDTKQPQKLPLKLPLDDPLSRLASGFAVHTLYSAMLHPPQTYLGNKFQYRSADGSDNNMLFPQLGKAGMPYAKSVPNLRAVHGSQPDPGDLFDLLLARDGTDEEDIRDSNLGISSMLLYHATVIIHDIFRTNVGDKNISDTSSYLDLSPLYGKDAENQRAVRSFKRGLLKPDSFAEERLLNQPVGVCIYLVMYNRFHNYVAQQLLEINENDKFFKPPPERPASWRPNANWQPPKHWPPVVTKPAQWEELDPAKWWPSYRQSLTEAAESNEAAMEEMWELWKTAAEEKLDEDLFQTARLITCGMYINISIHDYLRVLTRVHLEDTPWTLDPRKEIPIPGIDRRGIQRGQGNQVSVEFNVLYRFHSPLSRRDMKWTSDFLKQLLQGFVKPKDESSSQGGHSLTQEQLDSFDIPIPVMSDALKKMYEMLPTVNDKVVAPAIPIGLVPILEGDQKGSYKYKRDPKTQKFNDIELVKEMVKVMEDPTCEFGAKNTARLFRSIEILGILQARKWELASLNEFRKFFGLREHKEFEDINQDPDIARKLRNLYRHPDQVELYPGLVCEGDGRCLDPGTEGPKGGTALWSAVLSDAVTLVRSDRFYTTDWNVGSLTGWGMREVSSVPEVMKGSVMHRLFQRAFPGFFKYNSLHLWQPFHIPAMNYVLAKRQGKLADLEDLSEMGVKETTIKQVDEFVASMKGDLTKLKAFKSKPLRELEAKPMLGYTKTEIKQIQDIFERGKPEIPDFGAIQLAFKPWKRLIKMPDKRFGTPKAKTIYVTNYSTIVNEILAKRSIYKNPGFLDYQVIPGGPLRAILTGKFKDKEVEGLEKKVEGLVSMLRSMVTPKKEQVFMDYFTQKAQDYLSSPNDYPSSRKRDYQKLMSDVDGKKKAVQVWQIDIVSDYAIPIVAQFIADFLGFWDDPEIKLGTEDARAVYEHLSNCQDYLTYDSDETTVASQRIAFEKSIGWLNERAKYGVNNMEDNGAKRGANGPKNVVSEPVSKLRQFGTQMAKELLKGVPGGKTPTTVEEAAAIRLSIALDAVHKSILTFTEVLNYLLHKKVENTYLWENIQSLAFDTSKPGDSDRRLSRYVLEAQRLAVHVPLVRQIPNDGTVNDVQIPIDNKNPPTTRQFEPGDMLLLQVDKAQQDPELFPNPTAFDLQRKKDTDDSGEYIIYGRKKDSPFTAKHLTIIAITALIKQVARLKNLRRAHNTEGRLNTAKTPDGVRRYLTQEFDQLVPFPTTWQLRFDGEGQGVWEGGDNSEVEHGMEQIYQDGALSADGGYFNSS